jgi:hypothetical protein
MNVITIGGKTWDFDEDKPLGSAGGFGAVFLGADEQGNPAAVKRLHLKDVEHAGREMQIAEYLTGHEHPHVIPIYAAGKDEGTGNYFVVMAKADKSLNNLINESAPLPEQDAIEILAAVATGLAEIGELIHRDLKPENLLLHNGIWKLADLGLARFVEAATATISMKDFLSAPYAAPEQWRGEHATKTTDVYALGCILYALVTGKPPFPGPTPAAYGEQHQLSIPPTLPASPGLQRLALACLAKAQESRPSVESVRTQIEHLRSPRVLPPANTLAAAAAVFAERASRLEADQLQRRKVEGNRHGVAEEACKQLNFMFDQLFALVMAEAPNAEPVDTAAPALSGTLKGTSGRRGLKLGDGWLIVDIPYSYLPHGAIPAGWDMVVGGVIQVVPNYEPADVQRSANLWFGSMDAGTQYRWWEAGYMLTANAFQWHAPRRANHAVAPFAVEEQNQCLGGNRYGLKALVEDYQLAYNPKPVDGEHFDDWCVRWIHWFAEVAMRKLIPPARLPEEPIA